MSTYVSTQAGRYRHHVSSQISLDQILAAFAGVVHLGWAAGTGRLGEAQPRKDGRFLMFIGNMRHQSWGVAIFKQTHTLACFHILQQLIRS